MRRTLLTAIILIAGFAAAQAQHKWSVTPRIGVNISQLKGKYEPDILKTKVGLTAGAEAEYHLTPLIGLSAGVLYSQEGCKTNVTEAYRSHWANLNYKTSSYTLHYLNVPLLANLHVWQGLTLKTGIQIGYKFNAKAKTREWGYYATTPSPQTGQVHELDPPQGFVYMGMDAPEPTPDGLTDPTHIDKTHHTSIKPGLHDIDVTIPIGLSYEYKHFEIDARYHFALSKIGSKGAQDRLKNRFASITLGYKF